MSLLGSACADQRLIGRDDPTPRVLVPSPVFQQSVPAEEFGSRLRSLTEAIERLRAETSSGWVGVQDDETGYLAQLSGGSLKSAGGEAPEDVARRLLDGAGRDLFGISGAEVDLRPEGETPDAPTFVLIGEQRAGGVPVLDGRLVFTVRAGQVPAVFGVRGRSFAGIAPPPEPTIGRDRARTLARRASGGNVGDLRLVVMPNTEGGTLAWEVTVTAPGDPAAGGMASARYYLDAATGTVLSVVPASAERVSALGRAISGLRSSVLGQVSGPPTVEVSGAGPLGQPLQAVGTRRADGAVLLVDPTGEGRTATIETHDGTAASKDTLPGPIAAQLGDGPWLDADTLAAHAYGRYVLEYYLEAHARRSWDGQGGKLISTANMELPCNAYFNGEQMVYGDSGGCPYSATDTDIDTAGHEITHGVTDVTAGLIYSGQSGALNESFSDYFGNVIGNQLNGTDGASLYEDGCRGVAADNPVCRRDPEGRFSQRYMLNGATLADYLYYLDMPISFKFLGFNQDNGGVHLNSAIWNQALWSIRTRLAQIDNKPGNDSPLARAFDGVVYAALTRHLGPTSGFLAARTAIEQAAQELQADPVILRVAREVFDQNRICRGCVETPVTPAVAIATSVATQKTPSVSGDRIAWLDFGASEGVLAQPSSLRVGGEPSVATAEATTISAAFAGDALIAAQNGSPPVVRRYDLSNGAVTDLGTVDGDSVLVGVAGSAEGAAWVDSASSTMTFVDPEGNLQRERYPVSTLPESIATGGGTVAIGTSAGEVVVWKPGQVPNVLRTPKSLVLAVGAFGDRVLAISTTSGNETIYQGTATLFDLASGTEAVLSEQASPFGAALSGEYAVWGQVVGNLGGSVAQNLGSGGLPVPDTDLYLFSFGTGTTYDVLPGLRGQQGFPALSGLRLAWQDAVNGGDDIYTGLLPPGL